MKKIIHDTKLSNAPPKLYNKTGILPSFISGGVIRHCPAVPAIVSFLNLNLLPCFNNMIFIYDRLCNLFGS